MQLPAALLADPICIRNLQRGSLWQLIMILIWTKKIFRISESFHFKGILNSPDFCIESFILQVWYQGFVNFSDKKARSGYSVWMVHPLESQTPTCSVCCPSFACMTYVWHLSLGSPISCVTYIKLKWSHTWCTSVSPTLNHRALYYMIENSLLCSFWI